MVKKFKFCDSNPSWPLGFPPKEGKPTDQEEYDLDASKDLQHPSEANKRPKSLQGYPRWLTGT